MILLRSVLAVAAVVLASSSSVMAGKHHRSPLSAGEIRERAESLPPDLLHEVAGMQYVLHPEELADLLQDSNPTRCRAWIDAWWNARDPIPTDADNEAREEHEQRVLTAQAKFGRGAWPGWDDRGEVLIRYGAPAVQTRLDADVVPPGIYVPAEMVWYYPQFNVYARFFDTGFNGYAQYMETVYTPPSERARSDRRTMASKYGTDVPMDYMDVDMSMLDAGDVNTPMAGSDGDRFLARVYGYYDLEEKMPAVYSFDYPSMHIPAFFSVQSFRGGDGVDRVDVNTEFHTPVLPIKAGSHCRRFVTTSVFWSQSGQELARVVRTDSVGTGLFALDSLATVLSQITMTLPSGTYRMAVTVQEEGSGRFATARRTALCHDMEGGIAMSDLSLARSIGPAREDSPFNRGPLEVVPCPSGVYRMGQSVPVYFEVYHVGMNHSGARAYAVEYTIKPKSPRRRSLWSRWFGHGEEPMQVRSGFDTVAMGPDDYVHVSASTRSLWPGEFVLEVAVTDGASSRRVVRSATFRLVE